MDGLAETAGFAGPLDQLRGQTRELHQKTHETIRKVGGDIEDRFHLNTAISAVMELVNLMHGVSPSQEEPHAAAVCRSALESVVLLLGPFVPHFSEEIWQALGNDTSVLQAPWPEYSKEALVKEDLLIVVQVNGKLRHRFIIAAEATEDDIRRVALADPHVLKFIEGKAIRKVVVVKRKLVNIVV
jgi:leucyl-tRNA synthetase